MIKNKAWIVIMLGLSNIAATISAADGSMIDLEFYVSTLNCIPKYFYCKNNVAPTNTSIDCLTWGQCRHLRTLIALLQTPYVQNYVLANNSQLRGDIAKTLTLFGRDNLSTMLTGYNVTDITNLINDLLSTNNLGEGGQDITTLANAGLKPIPPVPQG